MHRLPRCSGARVSASRLLGPGQQHIFSEESAALGWFNSYRSQRDLTQSHLGTGVCENTWVHQNFVPVLITGVVLNMQASACWLMMQPYLSSTCLCGFP